MKTTMTNKVLWTVGSVALVSSAAMAFVACSSSTTDTAIPTTDSGSGPDGASSGDSGSGSDGGTTTDSGGGKDAGPDCGRPATLHPPTPDGGIFCPFSATDGGKNIYCPTADQCCASAKGGPPSTCVLKGSACPNPNDTVWQCEDPSDCPGQKCCAHGGDAGVTVKVDTCGSYLSKFAGTRCAASCGADELVVCEAQSACSTGTCTAVNPKGNDIGVCK